MLLFLCSMIDIYSLDFWIQFGHVVNSLKSLWRDAKHLFVLSSLDCYLLRWADLVCCLCKESVVRNLQRPRDWSDPNSAPNQRCCWSLLSIISMPHFFMCHCRLSTCVMPCVRLSDVVVFYNDVFSFRTLILSSFLFDPWISKKAIRNNACAALSVRDSSLLVGFFLSAESRWLFLWSWVHVAWTKQ